MTMKLASLALVVLCGSPAMAREVGVEDVLSAAEQASPELKAAAARESQARDAVVLRRYSYYPTLDAEGVDSWGFAGSNGALGLGGVMSSPFRKGLTGGLVSQVTLFDLSRGYGVRAEKSRLEAAQARTRVVRYMLDQAALRIYFEGVRDRGQMEAWQQVGAETAKVMKDVEKLVRTGQHSPVEGLLVQDQVDDAAMTAAAFEQRYKIALKRLSILTGLPEGDLACPNPSALLESSMSVIAAGAASPAVERAQADAAAAKSAVGERESGNYPTISAIGSIGGMDKVRLVDRADYSAGVGVRLPLFEGFRTQSRTSAAKDAASEGEYNVLAAKLQLDESNAAYDEVIETSRVKLGYLDRELEDAIRALGLAQKRYLSFEGPLVDVRESIRNLARIQGQRSDVKADLLLALGAKAVLNGGHINTR